MSTSPHTTMVIEPTTIPAEPSLDQCDSQSCPSDIQSTLTVDRSLVVQAMHLLICLDQDLSEARAQFNQDWFRRIMRARPKAVSRLRRRWSKISSPPGISLGNLRRPYHSNLAKYLYQS